MPFKRNLRVLNGVILQLKKSGFEELFMSERKIKRFDTIGFLHRTEVIANVLPDFFFSSLGITSLAGG